MYIHSKVDCIYNFEIIHAAHIIKSNVADGTSMKDSVSHVINSLKVSIISGRYCRSSYLKLLEISVYS